MIKLIKVSGTVSGRAPVRGSGVCFPGMGCCLLRPCWFVKEIWNVILLQFKIAKKQASTFRLHFRLYQRIWSLDPPMVVLLYCE